MYQWLAVFGIHAEISISVFVSVDVDQFGELKNQLNSFISHGTAEAHAAGRMKHQFGFLLRFFLRFPTPEGFIFISEPGGKKLVVKALNARFGGHPRANCQGIDRNRTALLDHQSPSSWTSFLTTCYASVLIFCQCVDFL